ncbi:glycoside hydrolase family 113 [Salisaeta longa]|uniref:glycoside hydrolase family 113 n=1 Tax=Salisaeta longa TaxID=503170 RepID=UPI0003B6BA3F|nr:hypothetical protein [Salisaeta longa]
MMRRILLVIGFALWGLGLAGCGRPPDRPAARALPPTASPDSASPDTAPAPRPFPIQAVTLDARDRPPDSTLHAIAALGTTHLTLIPFGWQRTPTTPHVALDTSDGWYSESHTGIRDLARRARRLGMGVILKPHIWIGGYSSDGQARHRVLFEGDNWRRWSRSYTRFILTYARLARAVQADVLVLGTEIDRTVRRHPAYWRALIDTVRSVYAGKLTYAANWHNGYTTLDIWDALDFIGVQAYFPLSDTTDPALPALRSGWQRHKAALHAAHRQYNRPVLFTELGYRSAADAARTPWRWPEHAAADRAHPALQARCYRAFFEVWAPVPWMAGAMVWKWSPRRVAPTDHRFTPKGKPAAQVIRHWFTNGSAPAPARASHQRPAL